MKPAKNEGREKRSPFSGKPESSRPLQRWQREIHRLFGDPFSDWLATHQPFPEDWTPAVNVYEEADSVVVEAELPGMTREQIQIYVSGDNLNIAGQRNEKRERQEGDTYRAERFFGRFHRMIPLPARVKAEAIDAHFDDGVLTVTCPKRC